jgi:hypothetical protein
VTDDALRHAVHSLTRGKKPAVIQISPAGISCVSRPQQDSLLEMLDASRVGGTGAHSSGSGMDSARVPINTAALTLWEQIRVVVNRWYIAGLGEAAPADLGVALDRWYANHIVYQRTIGKITEQDERRYGDQLWSWHRSIEAMFDPMVPIELTRTVFIPRLDTVTGEPLVYGDGTPMLRTERRPAVCPVCENDVAWDRETGDQVFALLVEYRRSAGEDALAHSKATCRFCGETWLGKSGCEALNEALDHQERERAALLDTP